MFTRLSVMAALAAAPAALFLGAGTAQADVWARADSAPGGVDVWVGSFPGAHGPQISGWCTFTSRVRGDPWGKPLPATDVPFFLPERDAARLWLPSYPTGSTWDVTVNCPNTGPQLTTVVW